MRNMLVKIFRFIFKPYILLANALLAFILFAIPTDITYFISLAIMAILAIQAIAMIIYALINNPRI